MFKNFVCRQLLTDHGGASCKCRLGALAEIIHRYGAQVGFHQAGVDIDPPWYHHPAVSLDHLDVAGQSQVLLHLPVKGGGEAEKQWQES